MMVGAPCSGKSTYVNEQLYPLIMGEKGLMLSTDHIIDTIADSFGFTYDEIFKDSIKLAEKIMYKMLDHATSNNLNIIWDQTNMSVKTRVKKLKCIPSHYKKECIVFSCKHDGYRDFLIARNHKRYGKNIPINVFDSMLASYEEPTEAEGFEKITLIDPMANILVYTINKEVYNTNTKITFKRI